METDIIVRDLMIDLASPLVVVFSDWGAIEEVSRTFGVDLRRQHR